MTSITTRAGKGTPLTHTEVDDNFTNLNADKLEASNNLSDVSSASAARTNLGLGTAATTASTDYATAAQGALADSAVQPDDDVSLGEVTVDRLTVDGKIAAGDELGNANLSNTLDYTSSAGVAGYRPINLIDSSAGVKISRPNDDGNGAFIEFQEWDSTITTLISRAMLTGEGGDLLYRNLTTGGGDHIFQGEANAELMRIDSSGSVGIGTSSPFDALHVEGTIRANVGDASDENLRLTTTGGGGFVVDVDDATVANPTWSIRTFSGEPLAFEISNSEAMRIDSSGQVGIGTSSPADLLNLSSSDPRIRLTNTGSGYCLVRTGGADASLILDADAGNTGAGSDIIMRVDNSEKMRIDSSGKVGIGTTNPSNLLDVEGESLSISAMRVANPDVGLKLSAYTNSFGEIRVETNHPLVFKTNGNNERMRIDSSGNVGIGTSSPSEPLHVIGQPLFTRGLELGTDGVDATSYISQHRSTVETIMGPLTTRMLLGTVSNHAIAIQTNNTERMRIDSSGNVGIGTTNNSYRLAVKDSGVDLALINQNDTVWTVGQNVVIDEFSIRDASAGQTRLHIDSSGVVEIAEGSVVLNGSTISAIQVTVADNAVAELTFTNRRSGMLSVVEGSDDDAYPDARVAFLGYVDFGTSPNGQTAITGNETVLDNTNTLTGTTGTDGKVTIGTAGTSGTLYLENRIGATRVFSVTLL